MKRLVLVSMLIAAVSGLHAQDDETAVHTAVGFSSRRIFRGVELAGAGATGAFQVGRDNWKLGAEINQPFERDHPGEGALVAAYRWHATRQLAFEARVSPRWSINPLPGGTKHSCEAEISAAWELASGFSVELAGSHDWRLKSATLQATLNYSQPLKHWGAYLEWSAGLGTSSGRDLRPDGVGSAIRDSYTYYVASVRLPYRISSRGTLIAGLHVAESAGQNRFWSPISAAGGFRLWFDVGLSVDF